MLARVYYCCHYIGDTIFGAALGAIIGYILESSL
jgi:hypothetical protein